MANRIPSRVTRVDAATVVHRYSTSSPAPLVRIVCGELTAYECHRMLETGGALDFWNDAGEDIYSMRDECDDDDGVGPEPCYMCGCERHEYTGLLCDACRAKWEEKG